MRKSVSTAIRDNREKVGISQKELAHILGVSHRLVSQWENGGARPTNVMVEKITSVLGVDLPETKGEFDLGGWVRREREQRRLTRGDLARRAGISPLTVYFIETGQTETPQELTVSRLQRVLGKLPEGAMEMGDRGGVIEDLGFRGPFPISEWRENLGEGKISCVYVFYDELKRLVRIGETDDLGRRLREYEQNYWWFRPPTVETFAYVKMNDPEFRRKTERVMIKLLGGNAVFNSQGKID